MIRSCFVVSFAALLVGCASDGAAGSDTYLIEYRPTEGATYAYDVVQDLSSGSASVEIVAVLTVEVETVAEDVEANLAFDAEIGQTNGDFDAFFEFDPDMLSVPPFGVTIDRRGIVRDSEDPTNSMLFDSLQGTLPDERVRVGDSWNHQSGSITFEAIETVGGREAAKLVTALAEAGGGDRQDSTTWVDLESGTVLQAEARSLIQGITMDTELQIRP